MELENRRKYSASQVLFYILFIVVFVGFISAEILMPSERKDVFSDVNVYDGDFAWVHDGIEEPIEQNSNSPVPSNEIMVIKTVLPEISSDRTCLCFRTSQQTFELYVDDELRMSYDTSATRIFGKNSSSTYNFCELSRDDSGKELIIKQHSDGSYSGRINDFLIGERSNLWFYLLKQYGMSTVFAAFILILGIITIVASMYVHIRLNIHPNVEHLGFAFFLAAVWLISESRFRDMIVPNASILSFMAYLMVMLLPYPVILYIDSIQKSRYRNLYTMLETLVLLNFILQIILQLLRIIDLSEMLMVSHVVIAICIISLLVTFALDIKNKSISGYRDVAFGLLFFMVMGILEIIFIYVKNVTTLGVFMCIGLIGLLGVAIARSIRDILEIEKEKQILSAEEARRRAEQMSLQMVQTLSTAIDAKDQYTNGHSLRVSEYSVMIATELGWNEKQIENLKYAALLHDIGKIGIPDTILNKPSRLTDTEYDVIKSHTTIGADILRNVTIIDDAEIVARHHHERYDGNGYPDHLEAENIPYTARIVAIADAYDAMNSRRVYRKSLPKEKIRQELVRGRGSQFDPDLLDIFIKIFDEHLNKEDEVDYIGEAVNESVESSLGGAEVLLKNFMATLSANVTTTDNVDQLTGLLMRSKGEIMISEAMRDESGCFIFMDIDNLKCINDEYGHIAGDKLLSFFGGLLLDNTENGRIIPCRLGGDEFIVYLKGYDSAASKEYVLELYKKFGEYVDKEIKYRKASLSMGLCMSSPTDTFQEVYSCADKALYFAKQNGKHKFYFYDNEEENSGNYKNVDLSELIKSLKRSGEYEGAMDVDYRVFAKLYEYVGNIKDRYAHSFKLAMITMNLPQEKVIYVDQLEQVMQLMDIAIKETIRNVDVCTRYSNIQFLVILFGADDENVSLVMDRILAKFYKSYVKNDIRPTYEIADYNLE